MPGIAASIRETWLLGSPPNSVEAPENSFDFEVTWAWISSPITISQSPVAPFISLELVALIVDPQAMPRPSAHIRFQEDRSPRACRPGGTNSRHCRDRLRHNADKHGPRLNRRSSHPEQTCAPPPRWLWRPHPSRPTRRLARW